VGLEAKFSMGKVTTDRIIRYLNIFSLGVNDLSEYLKYARSDLLMRMEKLLEVTNPYYSILN